MVQCVRRPLKHRRSELSIYGRPKEVACVDAARQIPGRRRQVAKLASVSHVKPFSLVLVLRWAVDTSSILGALSLFLFSDCFLLSLYLCISRSLSSQDYHDGTILQHKTVRAGQDNNCIPRLVWRSATTWNPFT